MPRGSKHDALRSGKDVYLIGKMALNIMGAKLPSKHQILKVMFYNWKVVDLSIRDSAQMAVKEAMIFWQKARIPTQRIDNCTTKLVKIHTQWQILQKSIDKTRNTRTPQEKTFIDSLDALFDMASENALTVMTNEEDKTFLQMQRQAGRPGCMLCVDVNLAAKENRKAERMEKEEARKRKHAEATEQTGIHNHRHQRLIKPFHNIFPCCS